MRRFWLGSLGALGLVLLVGSLAAPAGGGGGCGGYDDGEFGDNDGTDDLKDGGLELDGKVALLETASGYVVWGVDDDYAISKIGSSEMFFAVEDNFRRSERDRLIDYATSESFDVAEELNGEDNPAGDAVENTLELIREGEGSGPSGFTPVVDINALAGDAETTCKLANLAKLKNFRSTWKLDGELYDTMTQIGSSNETSCGSGSWRFTLETCHERDGTCQRAEATLSRGFSEGSYRWTAGYGGVNYANIINTPGGDQYGSTTINTEPNYFGRTYVIETSWEVIKPKEKCSGCASLDEPEDSVGLVSEGLPPGCHCIEGGLGRCIRLSKFVKERWGKALACTAMLVSTAVPILGDCPLDGGYLSNLAASCNDRPTLPQRILCLGGEIRFAVEALNEQNLVENPDYESIAGDLDKYVCRHFATCVNVATREGMIEGHPGSDSTVAGGYPGEWTGHAVNVIEIGAGSQMYLDVYNGTTIQCNSEL